MGRVEDVLNMPDMLSKFTFWSLQNSLWLRFVREAGQWIVSVYARQRVALLDLQPDEWRALSRTLCPPPVLPKVHGRHRILAPKFCISFTTMERAGSAGLGNINVQLIVVNWGEMGDLLSIYRDVAPSHQTSVLFFCTLSLNSRQWYFYEWLYQHQQSEQRIRTTSPSHVWDHRRQSQKLGKIAEWNIDSCQRNIFIKLVLDLCTFCFEIKNS